MSYPTILYSRSLFTGVRSRISYIKTSFDLSDTQILTLLQNDMKMLMNLFEEQQKQINYLKESNDRLNNIILDLTNII